MSSSKIAVLVDERDDVARRAWSWGHVAQAVHSIETHEQLLEALHACVQSSDVETIAVQGKDHFLGSVMTAWQRHFAGSLDTPLDFYPLPIDGSGCQVAAILGDSQSLERRINALLKRSPQTSSRRGKALERVQVETLWVSNSLDDGGRYAFNMATGWFYELWLATRRRGVAGLMQLAKMGGEVARQLSVTHDASEDSLRELSAGEDARQAGVWMRDRQEVASLPFGLLCGALPTTSFGVALSKEGGARQLSVHEEGQAVAAMARARAPLKVLKGEAGVRFDALHFEGLSHYMLDDRALVMEDEGMLYVRPGAPLWFVR